MNKRHLERGSVNGSVFTIVALVIAAIAALIMMGMIGRVIGDSRRETAVFRAIGAKRNDIRAIYSTYTFFLSLGIVVATLVIGTAVAAGTMLAMMSR